MRYEDKTVNNKRKKIKMSIVQFLHTSKFTGDFAPVPYFPFHDQSVFGGVVSCVVARILLNVNS